MYIQYKYCSAQAYIYFKYLILIILYVIQLCKKISSFATPQILNYGNNNNFRNVYGPSMQFEWSPQIFMVRKCLKNFVGGDNYLRKNCLPHRVKQLRMSILIHVEKNSSTGVLQFPQVVMVQRFWEYFSADAVIYHIPKIYTPLFDWFILACFKSF